MGVNGRPTINLLSGVAIVILLFVFFSLPVLASTPPKAFPDAPPAISPTISQSYIWQDVSLFSTSTSSITQTVILTDTLTPTITPTPTDTATPVETRPPTLSPTPTSTPLPTQLSYLPNLFKEFFNPTKTPTPTPPPPETQLYCDSIGSPIFIPDNDGNGINNDISISDGRTLVNLRLYLDIHHTYVGDLVVTLSKLNSGQTITTIHRPGPAPYGCNNSDIVAILDSGAARPADDICASYPHAISGIFLPNENLNIFIGQNAAGTWRLNVSDRYINDTGTLNHWCLETQLSDTMPAPTPTPTPVNLPPSAYIYGMSGQDQQLKLDCESRSAVDWAKHFGANIGELDFLNHLPRTDDPETGFVGNPNGIWGNIPPNDYGVHASPVADLLVSYGLSATAFKSLSWEDMRAEIASGHPVIVWIIGDNLKNLVNGTPHYYTAASTGNTTIVAPFEHTVILVGYSASNVTILNGSRFMDIDLSQFLDSWSALDFMAVLSHP